MNRLGHNLEQAATHYFHPQEIFVTTYNKAKHGAPLLRDDTLAENEFFLIAPERSGQTRYAFFKFQSSDDFSDHTLKLVRWVTKTTRAVVNFTRHLNEVGLLYSGPSPRTGAQLGAQDG